MSERLTITIPLFLTDAPHTKTAISLPELVRQTNAFSKKYRPGCTPKLLDSNPKALFLHYNVKCNKEDSDPAGHDVRIQFDITKVQESQKAKDLDVQISCSCPAFLYWGAQWNLHQRDGLLGQPRPKLVAPTERMDLRANFVICKHIHAVFERILPSVQHNIVNILREREVQKNKDKVRETPARLKKLQDELKKKQETEKIRKVKDKATRDKMLEALKSEEQARLMHEQELKNQGKTPQEIEREEPALEPEEEAISKAVPEAALPAEEERDLSAIQDLLKQEEGKVKTLHEEGKPHVHKGLPYDIQPEDEEDDKLMRKFESLHLHTSALVEDLKKGTKVKFIGGGKTWGVVEKIEKNPAIYGDANMVVVQFPDDRVITHAWKLMTEQRKLFAAQPNEENLIVEDFTPGMRVKAYTGRPGHPDEMHEGTVEDTDKWYVKVRWDDHGEVTSHYPRHLFPVQRTLFASSEYPIFKPGDRVRHAWDQHYDPSPMALGTVVKQHRGGDWNGFVIVDWPNGNKSRVNPLNLKRDETQKSLFAAKKEVEPASGPALTWEDVKPGVQVYNLDFPKNRGVIVKENKSWERPHVHVRLDSGAEVGIPISQLGMIVPQQPRMMFAAKLEDLKPGDRVYYYAGPKNVEGRVVKFVRDTRNPMESLVTVDWGNDQVFDVRRRQLESKIVQQRLF
jgi:preprotein translocase subunit YajC